LQESASEKRGGLSSLTGDLLAKSTDVSDGVRGDTHIQWELSRTQASRAQHRSHDCNTAIADIADVVARYLTLSHSSNSHIYLFVEIINTRD
jgi:hypothetical protein